MNTDKEQNLFSAVNFDQQQNQRKSFVLYFELFILCTMLDMQGV